jgi:hypothetical protein
MTVKQALEYAREKIVKANPDFHATRYKEGCQAGLDICGKKDKSGKYICIVCRKWRGPDREINLPMPLNRVLIALRKAPNSDDTLAINVIETAEREIVGSLIQDDELGRSYLGVWDLTKETLDEQEDETILSIAKLLGYESN